MKTTLRKRILVTGGAGFLGSHLCERLLAAGHEVLCVDNYFTGNKDNIVHLLDHPRFELMRHDVTFPLYVEVDEIYNLACPASPIHYQLDPVQTTKTSVHGAINMLGLAKRVKARIFQASTSEIYGDPEVHPQQEDYWGHVNPIGLRSCYDEGKRCAETLFFDYHRQHGLEIKVARIFNSLTGDQKVIYFRNGTLHHETFAECYQRIHRDVDGVRVPCFDTEGRMVLHPISGIWKHRVRKPGLKIRTTWGRSVTITADHSVFTRDADGRPRAVLGHELQEGDLVAVPRYIPCIERPLKPFLISDLLIEQGLSIATRDIQSLINVHDQAIRHCLLGRGIASRQHYACLQRYSGSNRLPLTIWQEIGLSLGGSEKVLAPFSRKSINNRIDNIQGLLWFLGFYLAEGCLIYREQQDYQLLFCSNRKSLDKLVDCVARVFGIEVTVNQPDTSTAPTVNIRSKLITQLVVDALGFGKSLSTEKAIPEWILQLPREQLVHFLLGFWEGDGNHDARTTGKRLIFNSSSPALIDGLCLIMARFGIVGSVSSFITRVSKERDQFFPAQRLTVQGLDCYDILSLATATQRPQARIDNDIAWARVTAISAVELDEDVYDFSVPGHENFVGGGQGGLCCHNTYGPRMHPNDGRVVSNLIVQALKGEAVTLYGDGQQTRSFCYVDDLIEVFVRLMASPADFTGPVNLGNPTEFTIRELAELVIELTGSGSTLVHRPLPADDPRQRRPDISLAREHLGWEPAIPLRRGLERTVAYFDDLLGKGLI